MRNNKIKLCSSTWWETSHGPGSGILGRKLYNQLKTIKRNYTILPKMFTHPYISLNSGVPVTSTATDVKKASREECSLLLQNCIWALDHQCNARHLEDTTVEMCPLECIFVWQVDGSGFDGCQENGTCLTAKCEVKWRWDYGLGCFSGVGLQWKQLLMLQQATTFWTILCSQF